MEDLLVFKVDKIKDGKIIKTYKIYANGETVGFDTADDIKYSISNYIPDLFHRLGMSWSDAFPKIALGEAASPSTKPSPV